MPIAVSTFLRSPNFSTHSPGHQPGGGGGEHVEEPRRRLLQHEADGVAVEDVDVVHRLEERPIGVAGDGEEAVVGELRVLRRQLATVHRGLRMPADVLAQLEHVRRVVRLRPRLGDVRFDRIGAGLDRRSGLHLHEPTVGERQRDHRDERDGRVRVEALRIELHGEAEDASTPGRLGGRRLDADRGRRRGHREGAAGLQELATCERGHARLLARRWDAYYWSAGRRCQGTMTASMT